MTGARAMGNRGVTRWLATRLRPEWPRLAIAAALGAASSGFLITAPRILGHATNLLADGLIGGHPARGITHPAGVDFGALGRVLGLAALLFVLSAIFTWAQAYLMVGVAQRTVYRLRQSIEEKLARLPLRYFDTTPRGELLSRVINDVDNVAATLQQGLSQFLTSVLTIVGVTAMMFWISPLLAGVSLVIIPLSLIATFVIGRRSKVQFVAQWQRTGRLNGLVEEAYTGHDLVLAFGQQRTMAQEFSRQNEQLRQASRRALFLSGIMQPAVVLLSNVNYVLIAAIGAYQVVGGLLTLGDVQAFIQYTRQFMGPVTQLASQLNQLQSGLASAERVSALLDEPEDADLRVTAGGPAAGTVEATGPRRVQFEHVSFRYDPGVPLIEDFTLDVEPGQTVAIVGATGAGKTTVVNLLLRFYEVSGGRILLDGIDYRDLTRDQVRRCYGMVLQDTWLFGATISDNIGYGKEGASEAEILAAARAAHADGFIRTLPDGYATVLDGDSSSLSAGQRQLLAIARAFLADPGILILDEATSNVDTRTEMLIQDAMSRLREGRTSIVIAHRLSTIRHADTIIVMDAGRIVEQGRHEALLSGRGAYHDLYNSQWQSLSGRPG